MWKLLVLWVVMCSHLVGLLEGHQQQEECAGYKDCRSCLELGAGCGWCPQLDPTKDICLPGTNDGPFNRSYTCNWWRINDILECLNEDECLPFKSCELCTQQLNCGWCGSVCLTGNSQGPFDTEAICFDWSWKSVQCSGIPSCEKYTTCQSCVKQKYSKDPLQGCGWDKQQKVCAFGTINNNIMDESSSSDWSWSPSQCEEKPLSCGDYDDCEHCVADSPQCGWCETSGHCINANVTQCDDLRYGTCRKSCYSQLTCQSCYRNQNCGYCSNFCAMGNVTRPQFLPKQYCQPWSYNQNCDLNVCPSFSDCGTCLSSGCHWCSGKCQASFGNGCCSDCSFCMMQLVPGEPSIFMHITVALLVCFGSVLGGLFITAVVFLFWKKYWLKRHHFKEFQ